MGRWGEKSFMLYPCFKNALVTFAKQNQSFVTETVTVCFESVMCHLLSCISPLAFKKFASWSLPTGWFLNLESCWGRPFSLWLYIVFVFFFLILVILLYTLVILYLWFCSFFNNGFCNPIDIYFSVWSKWWNANVVPTPFFKQLTDPILCILNSHTCLDRLLLKFVYIWGGQCVIRSPVRGPIDAENWSILVW